MEVTCQSCKTARSCAMTNSRISSIAAFCLYTLAVLVPAQAAPQEKKDWDRLVIQLGCDNSSPTCTDVQRQNMWTIDQNSAASVNALPATDRPLQAFARSEQTLIPLPTGEMTGFAGLAALALVRGRKAIRRFFL